MNDIVAIIMHELLETSIPVSIIYAHLNSMILNA